MQTHISILNDHFDWIQKNPKKFVRAIASGMNSGTEPLRRGGRWGEVNAWRSDDEREAVSHYVTVHQAHHMDTPFTLFAQHNSSYDIWDMIAALDKGFLDDKDNREIWVSEVERTIMGLESSASNLKKALAKATGKTEKVTVKRVRGRKLVEEEIDVPTKTC